MKPDNTIRDYLEQKGYEGVEADLLSKRAAIDIQQIARSHDLQMLGRVLERLNWAAKEHDQRRKDGTLTCWICDLRDEVKRHLELAGRIIDTSPSLSTGQQQAGER